MDETALAKIIRTTLSPETLKARQLAEFLEDCVGLNGDTLTSSEYEAAMVDLDMIERHVSRAKLAVEAMLDKPGQA